MIGLLIKNILLYCVFLCLCKYNLFVVKLYWTEYWREHIYHFISQASGRDKKTLHSLCYWYKVSKPLPMYYPKEGISVNLVLRFVNYCSLGLGFCNLCCLLFRVSMGNHSHLMIWFLLWSKGKKKRGGVKINYLPSMKVKALKCQNSKCNHIVASFWNPVLANILVTQWLGLSDRFIPDV